MFISINIFKINLKNQCIVNKKDERRRYDLEYLIVLILIFSIWTLRLHIHKQHVCYYFFLFKFLGNLGGLVKKPSSVGSFRYLGFAKPVLTVVSPWGIILSQMLNIYCIYLYCMRVLFIKIYLYNLYYYFMN